MHGIIDKATGKVYATSKKNDLAFSKLLKKLESAYPKRWFMIDEVAHDAIVEGRNSIRKVKGR